MNASMFSSVSSKETGKQRNKRAQRNELKQLRKIGMDCVTVKQGRCMVSAFYTPEECEDLDFWDMSKCAQ